MRQVTNSFATGLGLSLGVIVAVAIAAVAYYQWRESTKATPHQMPTAGTADQAKAAALGALQKRGIRRLAKECKATFSHDTTQWAVAGPAETSDGNLAQVSVLLSVGTIGGTRRWKVEYIEVDGKSYVSQ